MGELVRDRPRLFRPREKGPEHEGRPGRFPLRRLLAPLAGGWEAAAALPADEALAWAEQHLREKVHSAHAQAVQIWASRFPANGMGVEAPDPPEFPDF